MSTTQNNNSNDSTMQNATSKDIKWLPGSFTPGETDVIVGRGKVCYMHSGNKRLAQIVQSTLVAYSSSESKKGKSELIKGIMANIRESSPDGGFVKFDNSSGSWFEVGDACAREKVSQTFRDALNDRYKSSTTSKTLKRKQERISKLATSSSLNSKASKDDAKDTPMASRPQLPAMPLAAAVEAFRYPSAVSGGLDPLRGGGLDPLRGGLDPLRGGLDPRRGGLDPLSMRVYGLQRNIPLSTFSRASLTSGIDPLSLMLMKREQMARSALLGLSYQHPSQF